MNFFPPAEIWIEDSVLSTPLALRVRQHAGNITCKIIQNGHPRGEGSIYDQLDQVRGKRVLVLCREKENFIKPCPCSDGSIACGGDILNFRNNANAPACFGGMFHLLHSYPSTIIHANLDDLSENLELFFRANPSRRLRIGPAEDADSLDMEPLTGYAADLIQLFSKWPNATLELRTRTDHVDSLLGLEPGNAVISWFLNPAEIVRSEDRHRTASLSERLEAASRVAEAGYRVGFHFDPMIHFIGWQERYNDLMDMLEGRIDPKRIAWFSLGSLRFPPTMKPMILGRFKDITVFDNEFIIGHDGKMRYFDSIRIELFRFMIEKIAQRFERTPVYLCMEPPDVWRRVLGREPQPCELFDEILGDTG